MTRALGTPQRGQTIPEVERFAIGFLLATRLDSERACKIHELFRSACLCCVFPCLRPYFLRHSLQLRATGRVIAVETRYNSRGQTGGSHHFRAAAEFAQRRSGRDRTRRFIQPRAKRYDQATASCPQPGEVIQLDSRGDSCFEPALLVHGDAEQRAIDLEPIRVVDESQPLEFPHKEIDPRPCRADHLGQRPL